MQIGEKIKRIRTFRKLTQKELSKLLGLGENGDNRIAQYETNYRVPKKDFLKEIAKALNVNSAALYNSFDEEHYEIIEMLFWLEEVLPGNIKLFRMDESDVMKNKDTLDAYKDANKLQEYPMIGLWFNNENLNSVMKEWLLKKEELKSGSITKEDYFEWKINWPKDQK